MVIVGQLRRLSLCSESGDESGHHDCPSQQDMGDMDFYPSLPNTEPPYRSCSCSRLAPKLIRSVCCTTRSMPLFLILLCSLWLLLGFYGDQNIKAGSNYSRLLSANSILVKEIIVRTKNMEEGPMLYGFLRRPPLDNDGYWFHMSNTTVTCNHHKEWAYWLNRGSTIRLEYVITSPDLSLIIAVIGDEDDLDKWHYDNIDSEAALLLQTVTGSGEINFEVTKDGDYYMALGHPHQGDVQVNFKITVHGKLYSVEKAALECSIQITQACSVKLPFLGSQVALLTTPSMEEGSAAVWPLEVIYRSRWETYFGVIGVVLLTEALLVIRVFYMGRPKATIESLDSKTAPLLVSTMVSSYSAHSIDFSNILSTTKNSVFGPTKFLWPDNANPKS